MAKKISGNVTLTMRGFVTDVQATPTGHLKHSLGYTLVTEDEVKTYHNYQFMSWKNDDGVATMYPIGTEVVVSFKCFSTYTSDKNGNKYHTTEGWGEVIVLGVKPEAGQSDSTPQPASYNNKPKSNGADAELEEEF